MTLKVANTGNADIYVSVNELSTSFDITKAVPIAPDNDHLRNRLTHAIEVAQVAVSIARPLGLNVALTEAAALGHDCGHGPAGHASEDALSPFVPGGYHHAVYGADVVLEHLNLCHETSDAIRNHSWNRPAPMTPEGEVVAWADRIAKGNAVLYTSGIEGIAGTGMIAKGGCMSCSNAEIEAAVDYMVAGSK